VSADAPDEPGRPSHARVQIHYRRVPDRLRVYDQRVVLERDDVVITLSEPLRLDAPMVRDGAVMLETGSVALWFTFPGLWHDIGRFHDARGRFTGIYANILTPPVFEGPVWHTTDLFLDVWRPAGGGVCLLDEDELEQALARGELDAETAARARDEAARVMAEAARGRWPPDVVEEWTLPRALASLEG